jgi:4-aminobutyrate aminotransferase-like enzyme
VEFVSSEPFILQQLLADRGRERYELHSRYMNHQLPRMLHAIGFDKIYTRASGAYLYDDAGDEYLDMLAGFGVFALGRHHPVIRQAMHDVIDADLADLTQFDAPPLAGILAEKLLATSATAERRRLKRR